MAPNNTHTLGIQRKAEKAVIAEYIKMEGGRPMQYRNETITMMKAFAIILMVTAHSGFYSLGVAFINMFHMPVFFFCSGYCFKDKYLIDARTFVQKRVKGIYRPFVKWSLLFLALHNVFFHLNIYNSEYGFHGATSELYTWQIFVMRIFSIVTKLTGNEQLLGGYWFLHTLFFASFIAYATIRMAKRKKMLLCVGGLIIICLVMSATQMKVPFFRIGDREFMAAAFFIFGYHVSLCKKGQTESQLRYSLKSIKFCRHRNYGLLDDKTGAVGVIVLIIALFIVVLSACMPVSMLTLNVWNIVPYFAIAILGIYMTFLLSHLCNKNLSTGRLRQCLVFIGGHTLEILTWHFLSFKLVSLVVIWVDNRPIQQLACFPVIPADMADANFFSTWWLAYLVAGLTVPVIIAKWRTAYKCIDVNIHTEGH